MRNISCTVLSGLLLTCLGATPHAFADTYTINIVQSGSNVVATGSGSLSVSGSTDSGTALNVGVDASTAYLVLGTGQNDVYTGVTGPSNFGPGGQMTPTTETGGQVGFGLGFNSYLVPFGYTAGSPLTSTDTWDSATLSSLGLTDGTYTYTLGDRDMFVINIGTTTATPEPGTVTLLMTGVGLLGSMVRLQKRKVHGPAQTTI